MTKIDLKNLYTFSNEFVFRTPLLPFDLENNLYGDEEFIKFFFQKENIQEAIFLASPILYDTIKKYLSNEIYNDKEKNKVFQSFYKYFIRMQTRATPYGLFAGCGVGVWGELSNVILNNNQRYTRLDIDILNHLSIQLTENEILKKYLYFFPNNTIYFLGNKVRYIESVLVNEKYDYRLASIDNNYFFKKILKISENGATIEILEKSLLKHKISSKDALTFIDLLITEQLIVSEISPNVTGEEYIYQLNKKLTHINRTARSEEIGNIIYKLKNIMSKIEFLDIKIGNKINLYEDIICDLKTLDVNVDKKIVFQSDLFKKTNEATIDGVIQNELFKVINFVNKIFRPSINENLNKFTSNYLERYEDEEMPILQVLDNENGIGYPEKDLESNNILLNDLRINNTLSSDLILHFDKFKEILFEKFIRAEKETKYSIELSDDDFKDIDYSTDKLPSILYVFFNVFDKNSGKIHFKHCGNDIRLISRFANGNKEIHKIASELVKYEEQLYPNQIFAEIIHLPDNRSGNILRHPVFRKHEIPCLSLSSVEKEFQINLSDIYMKVVNGQILLRSKKLNKEIIPRLSSAHNYSFNCLPLYQFLCDLQNHYEQKSSIHFNINDFHNLFAFIPRVEYSNSILSPATWNFRDYNFQKVFGYGLSDFISNIKLWINKFNLPGFVCLIEGDKELVIDTGNDLSLKMFAFTIRNKKNIQLTEFLFKSGNALIKDDNNGVYTNECIAFLKSNKPNINKYPNHLFVKPAKKIFNKKIQRKFILGDEWLYYKIYCGVKNADFLLTEIIASHIDELIKSKLLTSWFFIRYNDPEFHIRLRLKLVDVNSIGKIIIKINSILKPYIENNIIFKLSTDTYNREIERYGGCSIKIAEHFFYFDSKATVQMLGFIKNYPDKNIRWLYAIICINEIFDSFSLTIEEKEKIARSLYVSFFSEHKGNKKLKIQLDNKYRKSKHLIDTYINPTELLKKDLSGLFNIIEERNSSLNPIFRELEFLKRSKDLQIDLNALLSSFIHMTLNRVFISKPRSNELVIYYFLAKFYQSKTIINKMNN